MVLCFISWFKNYKALYALVCHLWLWSLYYGLCFYCWLIGNNILDWYIKRLQRFSTYFIEIPFFKIQKFIDKIYSLVFLFQGHMINSFFFFHVQLLVHIVTIIKTKLLHMDPYNRDYRRDDDMEYFQLLKHVSATFIVSAIYRTFYMAYTTPSS